MTSGAPPSVGVVIATHNRPELMRRALTSVLDQTYDGSIDVVVVFDRSEVDESLTSTEPGRRVTVMSNRRTPGLAGARNTGILALECEFIAFCDDDDVWLPGKLRSQLTRLEAEPQAEFVTTAMTIDYGDRHLVRTAGRSHVTVDDLVRSRMTMLHSSSFLFRRESMVSDTGFGLVDENSPRSMAEDWDLLIRAARKHPIAHVDEPLVGILWGASSYFNDAWADKNAATRWLMEQHPEMQADRQAMATMQAKLAFGHGCLGERREGLSYARSALRRNWREPRTPFALLVLAGVPGKWVIETLNKRGHGI